MLGHKVVQSFHREGLPVACTLRGSLNDFPLNKVGFFKQVEVHEGVDVMDLPALERKLKEIRPEFLLNCIGIIKQRDEAKSAIPSITINSLLPHLLADWAKDWGGRVIHFSTDCVFTGSKGDYLIDDPSDAADLYGKSKYLGEVNRENALTLRTSIIGRELSHFASLVEWFLSQEGRHVRGFTRAIYTGMTTETMADLLRHIITNHPGTSGVYHAVSDKISKYDLLLLLRESFGMDVEIEPDDTFFCDRSMLSSGLEDAIGFQVPSWKKQIDRMAQDKEAYGEWR
jgi:dTDP-4-dehydrorhamnose reductase